MTNRSVLDRSKSENKISKRLIFESPRLDDISKSTISLIKKSFCYYHPEQLITNFCKNIDCLLPLCPECVNIHTMYHKTNNNYGELISIENALNLCISKINQIKEKYKETECKNSEIINQDDIIYKILRQKIEKAKNKILDFVNNYFFKLENEIKEKLDYSRNEYKKNLKIILKEFNEKNNKINNVIETLNSSKFLKVIINVLSPNFKNEFLFKFQDDFDKNSEFLKFNYNIVIQENYFEKIKKNIQEFVSIKNKDNLNENEELNQSFQSLILKNNQNKLNSSKINFNNPYILEKEVKNDKTPIKIIQSINKIDRKSTRYKNENDNSFIGVRVHSSKLKK